MICGHQFSVKNRIVYSDLFNNGFPYIPKSGEPVFLPRKEPTPSLLDDCQGSKTIVFDFIEPIGIVERPPLLGKRLWSGDHHRSIFPVLGVLNRPPLARSDATNIPFSWKVLPCGRSAVPARARSDA